MEDKKMNEQESIALIAEMIRETRKKVEVTAGIPFLVFGYLTVLISIAVWFLLTHTGESYWNFLWFGIPVIGLPLTFFLKRKRVGYVTSIDRIIGYIWFVLAACEFTFMFLPLFSSIMGYKLPFSILFITCLLMGIGTTLTGFISKLPILKYAGWFGIIGSLCFMFPTGVHQLLIFAVLFFVMMVLTGHWIVAKVCRHA